MDIDFILRPDNEMQINKIVSPSHIICFSSSIIYNRRLTTYSKYFSLQKLDSRMLLSQLSYFISCPFQSVFLRNSHLHGWLTLVSSELVFIAFSLCTQLFLWCYPASWFWSHYVIHETKKIIYISVLFILCSLDLHILKVLYSSISKCHWRVINKILS